MGLSITRFSHRRFDGANQPLCVPTLAFGTGTMPGLSKRLRNIRLHKQGLDGFW